MQAFPREKRKRCASSEADIDQVASSDDEPRRKKLMVENTGLKAHNARLKADNARLQELVNKQAEGICVITSKGVER